MFGYESLREACESISKVYEVIPSIGVVLGSGLGAWGNNLEMKIPYDEIPNMPKSTVVGHAGNLRLGEHQGVNLACLQGRVHTYEGYSMNEVVFGARLLHMLGCKVVLLTNAAGGISSNFSQGDLMLITDHINFIGKNPLIGLNDHKFGPRFPDMSQAYHPKLRALAEEAAIDCQIDLKKGIYASMLGPSYETPAEVRMLRTLGADAVGMSTVPEVIALNHMGVPTAAISCITNIAAGLSSTKLDHKEVEETARKTEGKFTNLLSKWVVLINEKLGFFE